MTHVRATQLARRRYWLPAAAEAGGGRDELSTPGCDSSLAWKPAGWLLALWRIFPPGVRSALAIFCLRAVDIHALARLFVEARVLPCSWLRGRSLFSTFLHCSAVASASCQRYEGRFAVRVPVHQRRVDM